MIVQSLNTIDLSSQQYRGYTICRTRRSMWVERDRKLKCPVPVGQSWLWARIKIDQLIEGIKS